MGVGYIVTKLFPIPGRAGRFGKKISIRFDSQDFRFDSTSQKPMKKNLFFKTYGEALNVAETVVAEISIFKKNHFWSEMICLGLNYDI